MLNTGLSGKAPSSHSHDDRYYTKYEVSAGMAGKADSGHTHDDRYYTEAEINNMLPLQNFITGINLAPKALNTDYSYANAALKNKKCIVAIFYSSVGNVLVTSYTSSRGVLNIKDGDQYWGGEVQVAYNSSTGTVTFKVVWIGGSQILSNFALTDILY